MMSNALLKMIEKGFSLCVDNNDIKDVCDENGEDLENILNDLQFKRIISIDDGKISILSDNWMTVVYNGKFFFGDNFNNRMVDWYESLMKESNKR